MFFKRTPKISNPTLSPDTKQNASSMNPNPMNPDEISDEIPDVTDETVPADAEIAADTAETPDTAEVSDPAALRALLDEANARAEAEHEAFLRARADFSNFKRRTEEERESLKTFLSEKMLKELLPIIDNFDRALLASETTKDYDKLIGGINAVYRQLGNLLTQQGVEIIDALHKPFDPNMHDAVMREETTEYPDNTVVAELQKGYTLSGRVLRPTMVRVSTGTE